MSLLRLVETLGKFFLFRIQSHSSCLSNHQKFFRQEKTHKELLGRYGLGMVSKQQTFVSQNFPVLLESKSKPKLKHTTYRKNNNLEKCSGMGLKEFQIR